MPELPEVETIRRQLEPKIVGKTITDIEIICPKSFQGDPKKIIGKKIISLTRIGKQLSINLSGNWVILAHFKMTGGLFFKPNKYTRVIIKTKIPLDKGGARRAGDLSRQINKSPPLASSARDPLCQEGFLYFSDLRKFGWLKLFTQKSLKSFQKNLGLDAISPNLTPAIFYQLLHSSSRPIKLVLLDQSKFAGIGNIYANDALFKSKIHPQKPANKISRSQSAALLLNLQKIMSESILHGGSTARDRGYIMPDGQAGSHQDHFLVYGRENEPCLSCSVKIKRIKQGGRSTFYCPHCQKL